MTTRIHHRRRQGTVLPMLACCLIGLFAFVALAIDLGLLAVSRTNCQNAADVAALVGARNLNNAPGVSTPNNVGPATTAAKNTLIGVGSVPGNSNLNNTFVSADIQSIKVGTYTYSTSSGKFSVTNLTTVTAGMGTFPAPPANSGSWTAFQVTLATNEPTYFMKVMGVTTMPSGAVAVAVHRPRDIAVVLDFSVSMRFGSLTAWETGLGNSNGETRGYINPDPRYPQFGHYARYTRYQKTTLPDYGPAGGGAAPGTDPLTMATGTVANRPNPLCMQVPYIMQTGEVATPNNHTMNTPNGPPILTGSANADGTWSGGFFYDTANPPAGTAVTPGNLSKAFLRWSPPITAAGNPTTYTPDTHDWSSYNASTAATPAPDYYKDQTDTPVAYKGDKWAKTDGTRGGGFSETAGTRTAAATLAEFLGYGAPGAAAPSGYTWDNFASAPWQTYGYDLKVDAWKATKPTPSGWSDSTYVEQTVANRFQGYSMGPMYWGKTFYNWPPDPRFDTTATLTSPGNGTTYPLSYDSAGKPMCDWRRRFFTKTGGTAFNSSTDNINKILLNNGTGYTFSTGESDGTTVVPNYSAILAWLKSGPQVLPPNLRSGRVLYYTSIPDSVSSSGSNLDQRFWKEYIDFVLGRWQTFNYDPKFNLAGVEYAPWPESTTVGVSQGTLASQGAGKPVPYMNYADNPSRPRMHMWFGPATMLDFLISRSQGRDFLSGTVHEAQDWQLKAGINSALDDIKANHPNDQVGLAYFANFNFSKIRVPMGQDYTTLKNALFYPNSLLDEIKTGDTTTELRPFDTSFNPTLVGNLPNANGGTDPVTGLALAYNMLSPGASHSTLTPPWGTGNTTATGRTGAAKIVLFETDGVPNGVPSWSFNKSVNGTTGANQSYFANSGSGTYTIGTTGPLSGAPPWDSAGNAAIQVVNQIVAPTTATNPGYSLPNAPARVYGLAYGDLFYYNTTRKTFGLKFLYNLQIAGNALTADGSNTVPSYQIITGPYDTRIANIRDAMQRIIQSGVQVTLLE